MSTYMYFYFFYLIIQEFLLFYMFVGCSGRG